MAELLYQGHASFRIKSKDGVIVYIDPFAGSGYELPADIILVTHQHGDHNCINLPAKNKDCIIIQNSDALVAGTYRSFSLKQMKIQAVPAYNKMHDKRECVGYLILVDGIKLYFAGDTSETKEMKELAAEKIDYAFLPIDGIYNMDIKEAERCSKVIKARHTVPIHMKPGALFSEERAAAFDGVGKLVIRPGDVVIL
jgi:L-ascorbate metabolism protein UlaG (beta-lactamase superfamily)